MITIKRFIFDTCGATSIEYCMIAGSVVIAIVSSVTVIGSRLNFFFQQIAAVN